MIFLIAILCVLFGLAFWGGYHRIFRLEHLNEKRLINGLIIVMIVLTLLSLADWLNLMSQAIAGYINMGAYSTAAGFFFGSAFKLYQLRSKSGNVRYIYRTFWTENAPALLSVILIAFGIYRTSLISLGPFTGIGITSGISLIAFGVYGWTIRVVPEFRARGVLILDQYIEWEEVLTYSWDSEESLRIDYYGNDDKLTDFTTYIPAEDRRNIEQVLETHIEQPTETPDPAS